MPLVPLFAALLLLVSPAAAQDAPLLVDARWLQPRLADPGLRVVDMGTDPGDYTSSCVCSAFRRWRGMTVRGPSGETASTYRSRGEAAGYPPK